MNVDTFHADPSIRYYFASAVPLMVLVLLFWYLIKHSLAHERQTPYQRGIYEDMFYKMANKYPKLWARTGPREGIKAQSLLGRLKWRLIMFWNDPEKTIQKRPGGDSDYDDLGAWARFKRILTRRWTSEITNFEDLSSSSTLENGAVSGDEISVLTEKANGETMYASASAPASVHQEENRLGVPYSMPASQHVPVRSKITPSRTTSPGKRPSSNGSGSPGRSSGIMVEEEPATWLKDYGAPKVTFY